MRGGCEKETVAQPSLAGQPLTTRLEEQPKLPFSNLSRYTGFVITLFTIGASPIKRSMFEPKPLFGNTFAN